MKPTAVDEFMAVMKTYGECSTEFWRRFEELAAKQAATRRRISEQIRVNNLRSLQRLSRQTKGRVGLTSDQRYELLELATGHLTPDVDAAHVDERRLHILRLAARHRIHVRIVSEIRLNGYAFVHQRAIEVPPAINATNYAVQLHELGHVVRGCIPTDRPVKRADGSSVCVGCEIGAWRWAQANALHWTKPMHRTLGRSIRTYQPYATAVERRQIDELLVKSGLAVYQQRVEAIRRS